MKVYIPSPTITIQVIRIEVQKTYAMVIGAVLVLVGLVGFVSNPLVGVPASSSATSPLFGANTYENILHIVVGALGLWFGMKSSAKSYNMGLGIGAAVVGLVGLVPQGLAVLFSVFAINTTITYLHLAIAVVSLGVAYGLKR